MKLASYFDGEQRIGLVEGDRVWNLRKLAEWHLREVERVRNPKELAAAVVPIEMASFIRLNADKMSYFSDVLAAAKEQAAADNPMYSGDGLVGRVKDIKFLPPVNTTVICCGSSYRGYMAELKRDPSHPRWPSDVKISFFKNANVLIGHKETILYPSDSEQWDYENELSIIIGKPCSDITEEEAGKYIFGYTIFNDACVRDIASYNGGLDAPRGKSVDTLGPCGPWIVPSAYLGKSPNELNLETRVDGKVRQKGNTSDLLWPIERIVAVIARYIRLKPGDIIATGTTTGNAKSTSGWLKVGQKVELEWEGIGVLENTVGRREWKNTLRPYKAE